MTVTDIRNYPTDEDAADMCELAASMIEALGPDLERLRRFVSDLSAWCANNDTTFYQQLMAVGRAVDMLRNSGEVFEGVNKLLPQGDTDDVG